MHFKRCYHDMININDIYDHELYNLCYKFYSESNIIASTNNAYEILDIISQSYGLLYMGLLYGPYDIGYIIWPI